MEVDKPWLVSAPLTKIEGLPDFGWRLRLDHQHNEKCVPFTIPRLHQLPALLPLIVRYTWTWYKMWKKGRKLFIDNLDLVPWRPIYGVPIGGIGCGTIGRGYRGEFCRFQMIPGMYKYNTVDADQFIVNIRRKGQTVYQQVLNPLRPSKGRLDSWNWAFDPEHAHYQGLYPRAWSRYELPGQGVTLICRQISPVFPHDYKDTSLPAAVFVWSVENHSSHDLDVSITFSFQNGQGEKEDLNGGVWSEPFSASDKQNEVSGVMIHQQFRNMTCVYGVGARHKSGVRVSHKTSFDPSGSGSDLWMDLMNDGELNSTSGPSKETKTGEELASAVCIQCSVPANQSSQAEFSLTWDMPIVHFGANEKLYARRYARWFGTAGDATPRLASYALNTYEEWEKKIDDWQSPILNNSKLPAWYKSALFNELYFVSDGGTVWLDPYQPTQNGVATTEEPEQLPPVIKEYSRFAYLEGHEYRMFNTYDVHHYASFALIMLWPKLQLSLQYDIAESVPKEDPRKVMYCMSGEVAVAKASNAVPHDIGDPDDEPWKRANAYLIHPTQEWKDLNTKFVLQVFRDYSDTKDKGFLVDMYPVVKAVMEASLRWDVDDDGIIDNSGFPDQTYDAWSVVGASAYCGGMWLAAVRMFVQMAQQLGHKEDADKFSQILEKGKASYEKKLWNGEYYNYDSSTSKHADSVMADQLAGQWFLKASKFPDSEVFPKDHVVKALEAIYKHNVLPFDGGKMGAINGMRPDGTKDVTSCQSDEFWTGVTYSLGALMFQEDMIERGWQVGYGAYHVCYERYGLAFQTPEAYFDDRRYRSLGYMRPLCIWAMQHSLELFQPQLLK